MEGWVELSALITSRPGIKPTTALSKVRHPNHYNTKALCCITTQKWLSQWLTLTRKSSYCWQTSAMLLQVSRGLSKNIEASICNPVVRCTNEGMWPRWPTRSALDWIVQCLTSPPTQYRLYGRRFLQVKRSATNRCNKTAYWKWKEIFWDLLVSRAAMQPSDRQWHNNVYHTVSVDYTNEFMRLTKNHQRYLSHLSHTKDK